MELEPKRGTVWDVPVSLTFAADDDNGRGVSTISAEEDCVFTISL